MEIYYCEQECIVWFSDLFSGDDIERALAEKTVNVRCMTCELLPGKDRSR